MSAPLSNEQKAAVCQNARKAFDYLLEAGKLSDAADAEEFRQEQQLAAVGKKSLTSCDQSDFAPLMAHFYNLRNETGLALKWQLKAKTDPQRTALNVLDRECQARGLTLAYPAGICTRRRWPNLEDLSAKQIWTLVFTVRNSKHKPIVATHPPTSDFGATREAA